jgi:hypothetical protein
MTLSGPSCATSQVPTIGSKVIGGLPTCSLLRSILISAALTIAIVAAAARVTRALTRRFIALSFD